MAHWLTTPLPQLAATIRLFCFPPAGAGASLFHGWAEALPSLIEVSAVHLPGREVRIAEPPFTRMGALVEAVSREIELAADRPFALFGHSLGGWVAFELARKLRAAGGPTPSLLLVAGCGAPHVAEPNARIHDLPDAEFLAAVRALNGIPEAALAHPELIELMLPTLRADFTVYETYRYTDAPVLGCPITAFGGREDPRVPRSALEAWSAQTTGRFDLRMFDGDHFFLNTARAELLRSIAEELQCIPL